MPADPYAPLRPHLAAVWADRDDLVTRVAAEVIAQVPSYARTPSSEVWIGMTRILERITAGDPFAPPSAEDLHAAAGTGIQGAGAGIAAEDLAAAILLGAREVEGEVMQRAAADGVPADVQLAGARAARRWAEDIAVAGIRALVHTTAPTGRNPGADLVAALRTRSDAHVLVDLASAAGIDPGEQHVVVVARAARNDQLDEVAAAQLRFAHRGAVWARDEDAVTGIVHERPTPVGGLVIGAAGPASLTDLADALTRADRAAHAAAALLGPGTHDLDSLGLLVAVHEDPSLRDRLDRRWLTPLRAEARHDLVRTVREWQHAEQVDAVATALSVHPNTVRNRLARIDALLPGWRHPQAQAELWAALVADAADRSQDL